MVSNIYILFYSLQWGRKALFNNLIKPKPGKAFSQTFVDGEVYLVLIRLTSYYDWQIEDFSCVLSLNKSDLNRHYTNKYIYIYIYTNIVKDSLVSTESNNISIRFLTGPSPRGLIESICKHRRV